MGQVKTKMHTPVSRLSASWTTEASYLLAVTAAAGVLLTVSLTADGLDRSVLVALTTLRQSSGLFGASQFQEAARDVTSLGSMTVLGIVATMAALYLSATRRRRAALYLVLAVISGVAMNAAMKVGFARPRPGEGLASVEVFTSSFPSSHATLSAVTYLFLAAVLARKTPSTATKAAILTAGILLTTTIGISRTYLGVHYPSDVLAGWCTGAAWALLWWLGYARSARAASIGDIGLS